MQFKALLVASLFSPSLAAVLSKDDVLVKDAVQGAAAAKCYSGPSGYGHSNELADCIQQMADHPGWGEWSCGGRKFALGGSRWNSPADCVGGCLPCLRGSASMGLNWAKCDQEAGVSAHCWVGWCQPGFHFCGNSDGSCCAD